MDTVQNFYSNPAFCQKSEFINGHPPRALSPQGSIRHSPVGAQTIPRILDTSIASNPKNHEEDGLEEQEFYEEVVVDDKGFITDKKFVVVAQNNEGKKYIQVPQSEDRYGSRYGMPPGDINRQGSRYGVTTTDENRQGGRYGVPPTEDTKQGSRYGIPQQLRPKETKLARTQSQRYEYIQLQEQDSRITTPRSTPKKNQYLEDQVEFTPGRFHRYAVIETEQETELTTKNGKYALVPVEQLNNVLPQQTITSSPMVKGRYEFVQDQQRPVVLQSPSRYEYIQSSPQKPQIRYEYTQSPRGGNPIATQKLYELLSTPKKSQTAKRIVLSPPSQRKLVTPQVSPIPKESFQTKTPQKIREQPPRAQQKLNYALGTRTLVPPEKRHTAIVVPMCSSPIQSVYSETTFSNKSESWMNLSMKQASVQATLTIAAMMMLLCGGVTSGLCFYMISIMGRLYFLDFGVISGFTCLILGLLGFRTRNVYWLPNRNYISGYLLLSVFSLMTCAGLLVLLVKQPRIGTPLADITSGAVCGISVFSLALAAAGVFSSYCCKYPPPDNRVQHCAEGFSV